MLREGKIVLRDIGGILVAFGVVMLFLIPVSLYFNEFDEKVLHGVIIPSLSSIVAGVALQISFRGAPETKLRHALVTVAMAWLLLPAMSTLPLMHLTGMEFLDAYFESMSGWTSTGLTMFSDPSTLPHTIQFWRTFMQWIGGVGIIVLAIAILARPGTGAYVLYKSEAREERILPSVISTVRAIWWIYLLLTAVAMISFYACGMGPWDAINHAMTTVSTAGFSVTKGSIGFYNSLPIEIVVAVFMIIGAIPFLLYYRAIHGEIKPLIHDVQVKAMMVILLVGIILLTLENMGTYHTILESFRYSAFQFISGLATCGHQTADLLSWSPTAKMIVAISMIIGGCAGSTAGGIKLVRATMVYRGIGWWFRRISFPGRAMMSFRLGSRILHENEVDELVAETSLISLLWIIFLLAGSFILVHFVDLTRFDMVDVFFEVSSAQGNVGLSTGITNPLLHPAGKVVLIFNMWIGRLEIFPILTLFRSMVRGLRPA